MELVDFLRARLDEDRALALLACATGGEPDVLGDGETPIPWQADHAKVFVAGRHAAAEATSPNRATHIARHDPARVLREIDAKRQNLAELEAAELAMDRASRDGDTARYNAVRAEWVVLRRVVRRDAAVYADRPGYREEWRP